MKLTTNIRLAVLRQIPQIARYYELLENIDEIHFCQCLNGITNKTHYVYTYSA